MFCTVYKLVVVIDDVSVSSYGQNRFVVDAAVVSSILFLVSRIALYISYISSGTKSGKR